MTADRLAILEAQFGLPGRLSIEDLGGYAVVIVRTPACEAKIYAHGAQVLYWHPAGQPNVFWCAKLPPAGSGKAIRGGVPVCWPWFGPHPSDRTQPQHGLVRTQPWRLVETADTPDGIRVVFEIDAWHCTLRLAALFGRACSITLTTANTSAAPVTISEALHAYFNVGNAGSVAIHGLDGARFRDNTAGNRVVTQHGICRIPGHTDAQYDVAPPSTVIEDPVHRRRISILRDGGLSTVVWNPGATAAGFKDLAPGDENHFVCVESGSIGPSAVTIPPGATHALSARYTVDPLQD